MTRLERSAMKYSFSIRRPMGSVFWTLRGEAGATSAAAGSDSMVRLSMVNSFYWYAEKMRELKSFGARLESANNKLGWTVVRIPFDVAKVWGKRGQMRVQGDINGFTFRTSLFPDGQGHHTLLVNKAMQKGGNA